MASSAHLRSNGEFGCWFLFLCGQTDVGPASSLNAINQGVGDRCEECAKESPLTPHVLGGRLASASQALSSAHPHFTM